MPTGAEARAAPPAASAAPNATPAAISPTEALMELTVHIVGPGASPNTTNFGAGFLLLKLDPVPAHTGHVVLVTAAHVLREISGPEARLVLRQRVSEFAWAPLPVALKIRDGARPLWTQHPTEDVAVEYVSIPPAASVYPIVAGAGADQLLATDETFKALALGPGDEVCALGYPYNYSYDVDFPILRTGAVATYPLLPLSKRKTFWVDFNVFSGNSGGPVFFYNPSGTRLIGKAIIVGTQTFALLGLVTAQAIAPDNVAVVPGTSRALGLAVVANSAVIKETIDRLPPPSP